jgi:serine/threonine protein kinase HipA of HipAB toxin-antitoxin module
MAEAAISGAPVGSSAGGEHPKFTAIVQRGAQLRHVLVKFSPAVKDWSGERWSDLLIAEHLASNALVDVGVTAAATELVFCGKRTFLESTRFDRTGERGRIGTVSLAALVDHHLGRRDNWTSAAVRLKALRVLSAESAEAVRRAATFGQLIGNTDMHFGKLSFFSSFQGTLSLAPVYDMLPMAYAPVAGEELPQASFEPPLPAAGNLDIWPAVAERAETYWREVAEHEHISSGFGSLAARNAAAIARARKLLP